MGFQGQMFIYPTLPPQNRYDFVMSNVGLAEQLLDANGLRGQRAHDTSRICTGIRRVGGQILLQPTAPELAAILAWALYGVPSGSGTVTYPFADSPILNYVMFSDAQVNVRTYSGCAVNRITIRGSQNDYIKVILDVIGIDEAITAAGSQPNINLNVVPQPFLFQQLVLTIGGTAYQVKDFEFVVENMIADRFYNSPIMTSVIATDRHVTFNADLPEGTSDPGVYGFGNNGVPATAVFTGLGTQVFGIGIPLLTYPRMSSTYSAGHGEVMLPIRGICPASQLNGTQEALVQIHL